MKTFTCQCGNTLHFENSQCLACGRMLGFVPALVTLSAMEPEPDGTLRAVSPGAADGRYRQCRNYAEEQVCNWMVPVDDPQVYCLSCRLNQVIPNLGDPANRLYWYRIELAKRRFLYTLLVLELPISGKGRDPQHGLAFKFLADEAPAAEFSDEVGNHRRVVTGHRAGTITINVAEADAIAREEMREKMNEAYRTLLGHFRHESGHYYWDRLVAPDPASVARARDLFGDEQADYQAALRQYYAEGPPPDWSRRYISAYACAHPWEDWAETWAHYLHMVDTLETARDMGFTMAGRPLSHPREVLQNVQRIAQPNEPLPGFTSLFNDWVQLTVTMNALNRSMGLADAYPFVLSEAVADKLRFVHDLVGANMGG